MTTYQFFSVKMFRHQFTTEHQFNNIAETVQTTQLANHQMPEFHCHCNSLKKIN